MISPPVESLSRCSPSHFFTESRPPVISLGDKPFSMGDESSLVPLGHTITGIK